MSMEDSAKECKTCRLILECIKPFRHEMTLLVDIIGAVVLSEPCIIRLADADCLISSYEFYISPHSVVEWPIFPASPNCREISTDSSSDECLAIAQEWILNCCAAHTFCKYELSTLPKRVIKVGEDGGDLVLHVSNGQLGKYAALSHCWGGDIPQKTTSHNVDSREENGIALANLSRTFQDAIVVTRKLGLEYLWIDSVCIVQDSDDDWIFHVATMAAIYRNAYVTIAADWAESSEKGCFLVHDTREAKVSIGNDISIHIRPFRREQGLPHDIKYPDSAANYAPCHTWSPDDVSSPGTPLESRAWAFQERVLSPRTLHFTKDELVFECREMICCECRMQPTVYHPRDISFKNLAVMKSAELHTDDMERPGRGFKEWIYIVQQYSSRSITVPTDRLPALAGIVDEFETQFDLSGGYKAGLWEQHMPLALLWYSMKDKKPLVQTRSRQQHYSEYVAPTWSWASLSCPVRYRNQNIPGITLLATLDHLNVNPQNPISNPYGAVSHGSIGLDGLLIEMIPKWASPNRRSEGLVYTILDAKNQVKLEMMVQLYDSIQSIEFDVSIDSGFPVDVPIGSQIYLMPIAFFPPHYMPWEYYRGIVLQSAGTDIYKRVGVFDIRCNSTLWETWKLVAKHSKVTIV